MHFEDASGFSILLHFLQYFLQADGFFGWSIIEMSAGAKICVDTHHIFEDVIYVVFFAIKKDPFGKAFLIKTFQIRSIKIRYRFLKQMDAFFWRIRVLLRELCKKILFNADPLF